MRDTPPFNWSKRIRDKRTVHRFGGAWAQALLTAVPWVNALLLAVTLLAVHNRIAITPGVMFDLPPAPFREGAHDGLTVLMLSVPRETQIGEETLVFFDDERYLLQDGEQTARLTDRLGERGHQDILLLADRRVPHGDVMRFVNMARKAGATRINVAEKPE